MIVIVLPSAFLSSLVKPTLLLKANFILKATCLGIGQSNLKIYANTLLA